MRGAAIALDGPQRDVAQIRMAVWPESADEVVGLEGALGVMDEMGESFLLRGHSPPPRGPAALYAPLGGSASHGYRPPLSFGLM